MQHLPFSSTAATLSDRISAAVPDRKRAAEIQLSLRSYRPVWDLAHQLHCLPLVSGRAWMIMRRPRPGC